jgi:hypothetical protein
MRPNIRKPVMQRPRPDRQPHKPVEEFAQAPIAARPDDWITKTLGERIEFALGCSLERAIDYLLWPVDTCNAHMLSAQKETALRIINIAVKHGLARQQNAERDEAIKMLAEHFAPRSREQK